MTAAPTTPLDALTQVIKGPSSTVPGLDGVLTIEEFERFAATNTATSSNRANTSIISTSKTPVSPPEAIPLGRARTTEYVSRFHHLCQTRGLTPTYDFFEPERERFGVRLSVAGKEIEERGPFVNKKIAKEAVAEKGCELLEGGLGAVSAAGQDGKVENWIGILTGMGSSVVTRAILNVVLQSWVRKPPRLRQSIKNTPLASRLHARPRFISDRVTFSAARTRCFQARRVHVKMAQKRLSNG